jgi:hypothetical protein|tara:strand:+ start:1214 stop:2032 length:819 start_codon:yes stop_codon:yes gene_type:complete
MSKVNYKSTPLVLLLDLDNTIIGDISPQIKEYYLIKDINKKLTKINKNRIKYNTGLLNEELEKYIIRPKFSKFLRNINKYDNIELFIYTASEKNWANYIIKQIQKVVDYKFNVPIFTRDDLVLNEKGNYKKSINHIKPLIIKSLKKKKKYDLDNINYIALIDNLKNILIEKEKLIKCPEFDYRHQINYLRMIPENILKKQYIIVEEKFNLKHSNNLYDFYEKYYQMLNTHYKLTKKNENHLNDKYWFHFSQILKQNLSNMVFTNLIKILRQI